MRRRDFLKNGSISGLSLMALLNEGPRAFVFKEATIDQLQAFMASGKYTSRALTEAYLQWSGETDKSGPMLHAVLEFNPDALAIADQLDKERKAGKVRGPLHGIPILVKDNIDTGDKMMTTAGSLALLGHRAKEDAFIVKKLREAGAVLLGKTNLSEWANFRSSRSTSGWSSRGGQTKNPYVLDRNPSGSSAGSGAAVAANLCAIAIGTETDGSIVSPSSNNGIVGIKPTVGLWSRSGIIPISATQDTAGPMARTVKDAAILLGALAGVDENDPVTKQSMGRTERDYTRYCLADGLKKKKIGIEKSQLKGHEGVVALYQQAIAVMKQQGAEIVEVELLAPIKELGSTEFTVLQYEFKDGLNKYLAGAGVEGIRSLADVIDFNRKHEAKAMPYFKQETLESSEAKGGLDSKEYIDALASSTSARKIIDDLMMKNQLDALVGVTSGPAICTDLVLGGYGSGFSFSSPAAKAGYPHITVPMGAVQGLPVGLSFVGGAYQEGALLTVAYSYEQASRKRMAPEFKATLLPV
ncbi:amidase [Flavitalea sp. BT771]|uniref:amidase n=1 Tax=Flavitalea sp. BT771 TaxID=3063329 RepID=UPI0026E480D9|nr:amidase [Flavitalea sp. BT771]MDO6434885.1 amidase [Flavitalea sp. BT771]MDV6223785.1 amidase [Flavitalea sp. BT771]